MDQTSELEEVKVILLKELNQRRAHEGRAPLEKYPEIGCTYCGEIGDGPLFGSAVPYIRTCQGCVLKQFPFAKLRVASGESITWYRNNPTFHRTSDYGIVLTDRAVYLYSPFWLIFSKWRRIPIAEIRNAAFHDSRLFPALRVQTNHGTAVLRTPPDYSDEMKVDRQNLIEAAEQVHLSLLNRGTNDT
jgi:hypothetical protein